MWWVILGEVRLGVGGMEGCMAEGSGKRVGVTMGGMEDAIWAGGV